MSRPFEVYDNEEVQLATRRKVGHLLMVATGAALITFVLLALMAYQQVSLLLAGASVTCTWGVTIWIIMRRLRQLRRIAWCIKISDERILGYDYARRPHSLCWSDISHVNIARHGVFLCGSDLERIYIKDIFPEYSDLTHRILYHAEKNQIPIRLEGQSLDDVDVYELYPFLTNASSHSRP